MQWQDLEMMAWTLIYRVFNGANLARSVSGYDEGEADKMMAMISTSAQTATH